MHAHIPCLHIVIVYLLDYVRINYLYMNVQIIINVTVMVYSKHMNNMIEDLIEVMVRC